LAFFLAGDLAFLAGDLEVFLLAGDLEVFLFGEAFLFGAAFFLGAGEVEALRLAAFSSAAFFLFLASVFWMNFSPSATVELMVLLRLTLGLLDLAFLAPSPSCSLSALAFLALAVLRPGEADAFLFSVLRAGDTDLDLDLAGDLERDGERDLEAFFDFLAPPFFPPFTSFFAGDADLAGDLDLAGDAERERDLDLETVAFFPLALAPFFGDFGVLVAGDLDLAGDEDLADFVLPRFSSVMVSVSSFVTIQHGVSKTWCDKTAMNSSAVAFSFQG